MSLRDCVTRAVDGGEMDADRAATILNEYDGVFAQMRQSMGHTQAQVAAARQVIQTTKAAAFRKRRLAQLQAGAVANQMQRMAAHKTITGKSAPWAFLPNLVSNKRGSGGQTLDGKYHAVRATLRGAMGEAVISFRANLVGGRRNKESLKSVVREVFGESTGDPHAVAIAQAWARTAETARTRFNAAGGDVAKRADWGLPQNHNSRSVRKAGYDAWRADILPRLDLVKMGRDYNNGIPFNAQSIEVLLKDAFEAIRTDGASRKGPSARGNGKSVANSRSDHRFFAFKSADDWMQYSERFGGGEDAFRIMIGHLDNMAMDIALMEELGPNPSHTFAFLKDAAMNMAQRSQDLNAPDKARRAVGTGQTMFDMLQGRSDIPHNVTAAKIGSAIRNYGTAALLGRAVLSSVTDINTARVTAGFVGIGKLAPIKMMSRIYRDPSMRADLAEAGMIFENAVEIGNAVARYEMEDMQFEAAARLADFTIRSTGLGWLTEARKQAFGGAVMHTLATDWVKKPFADLNPRAKRSLTDYGITETDWNLIRTAKIHTTPKGLELLRPQEVAAVAGQGVADRYLEALHSMMDFAVPSTDLRGRAMSMMGTQRGTIPGELVRFGLQFKGYSITLLMTHVARVVGEAQGGRYGAALSYGAGLVIGNTLLGGVAIQLKELAKGKDPRDMTTPAFWGQAFMQGGGVGILGDFILADQNRYGGGLAQTLAGPGVGLVADVSKLTIGNVQDQGENLGRDTVDFLRRWTPGGSIWYLSAAYEREVLDQLQQAIDPGAARSFRKKAGTARKAGSSYFYPPGSSFVTGKGNTRTPDLSSAAGG